MRRKDKMIDSPGGITEILRQGEICFLSMTDGRKPYVVPMNYGYTDRTLYFHSAKEGRKISLLRENPEVCFTVVSTYQLVRGDKACSWTARFRSVVGTGTASILTDPAEKEKGLQTLMRQYSGQVHSFAGMDLGNVAIIRVDIETITGKSSDAGTGGHQDAEKDH
jgi:nitroimidazol reductase NimA-like FMN-containing flavoprotein (pyridoxamine 5'-phosphate oxidase superfamily)